MLDRSQYLTKVWNYLKGIKTRHSARDNKSNWIMYMFLGELSKELYYDNMNEDLMGDYNILINDKAPCTKQLLQWMDLGDMTFIKKYIIDKE